jgi:hypothetical protein
MSISRRTVLWAILAVTVTIAATAYFRLPAPDALPRCLSTVLIAFETAQSPQEAAQVWHLLSDKERANLANTQYPDFAFILAYTFLFLVLAAIGKRRPIPSSKIAGKLAVISAVITGIADVGENCFALVNIASLKYLLPTAASVDLMRHFSLTKWAASGVTLILFWWIFLPSRRGSAIYRLLALTIAIFSVISGSMAVLGLWDITKIELVFPFLAPALLLQIPLFWRYWDDLLDTHAALAEQPIEIWRMNVTGESEV